MQFASLYPTLLCLLWNTTELNKMNLLTLFKLICLLSFLVWSCSSAAPIDPTHLSPPWPLTTDPVLPTQTQPFPHAKPQSSGKIYSMPLLFLLYSLICVSLCVYMLIAMMGFCYFCFSWWGFFCIASLVLQDFNLEW